MDPYALPGYAYVVWSTYPGLLNGFLHEYFWFIEIPVKSPLIPTMR